MAPHLFDGATFATSRAADRVPNQLLLRAVARHFYATPLAHLASTWTDLAAAAGLARLPPHSQHGDFGAAPLLSQTIHLWCSIGKTTVLSTYLGLDVVDVVSLLNHEVDALRALAEPASAIGSRLELFVGRAAAAQGIEVMTLQGSYPSICLCFSTSSGVTATKFNVDRIDGLLRALGPPKSSNARCRRRCTTKTSPTLACRSAGDPCPQARPGQCTAGCSKPARRR